MFWSTFVNPILLFKKFITNYTALTWSSPRSLLAWYDINTYKMIHQVNIGLCFTYRKDSFWQLRHISYKEEWRNISVRWYITQKKQKKRSNNRLACVLYFVYMKVVYLLPTTFGRISFVWAILWKWFEYSGTTYITCYVYLYNKHSRYSKS